MIYKMLPKLNETDNQIYARIDEDGLCRLTCTENNPDFIEWCKTNTPLPAENT
jgi:hypothetical protein